MEKLVKEILDISKLEMEDILTPWSPSPPRLGLSCRRGPAALCQGQRHDPSLEPGRTSHCHRQRLSAGKSGAQPFQQRHPARSSGASVWVTLSPSSSAWKTAGCASPKRTCHFCSPLLPGGKVPEQGHRRQRLGPLSGTRHCHHAWVFLPNPKHGPWGRGHLRFSPQPDRASCPQTKNKSTP